MYNFEFSNADCSPYIIWHWWYFGLSTFDSQFLMDNAGYLIVMMGVITRSHYMTCTGCVFNGFLFLSALAAHMGNDFQTIRNKILIIIGIYYLILDCYHKSRILCQEFVIL
jgi:hypothetical protein